MAKYTTRGEAIKELRKAASLSQEELARKLNTTKQTVYKYENGIVTNIPSDKIEAMSQIFNVSPAVIMGWDDAPTSAPLYEAAAGEGRLNDGYPSEDYKIQLEPEEFVVKVVGRSMEPTLQDGDIVIMTAQSVLDYPHQIALVKVDGEESTIKRVEVREDGIMLIGDNIDVYPPHFYTVDQVEQLPVMIEGVLTKLIREFK